MFSATHVLGKVVVDELQLLLQLPALVLLLLRGAHQVAAEGGEQLGAAARREGGGEQEEAPVSLYTHS